ncbi:dynamin family protein [Aeromonas taiwanensis]|nr:dynamin family protein [Aeromonas taiwanensis]TFF73554.1 hypothetical protein DRM95_16475 [Aeromonas taiwanensis]
MADHLCTQLSEQTVRERYALLSQACESTVAGEGNQQLEQQLQALEQIIEQELPALARKGSPDNITDLLQALRLEMARFREFCEYPALPSKVVVGLGGSFSAGKSSLINALIGDRQCLVTEVDPTTSLPTYLVQSKSEQTEVHAINLFNRVVSLSHEQFRTLTHDEKSRYGSQVSSLLKSVVVAHPALPWDNLALLDTPGYSKADQAGSERTDANLARTQLNSAQFIVWLVPADKGTITEEDISFLGTLDRAIPKLVVISRADKHPAEEIEKIVVLVRDTLAKRGLPVLDVIPFSNRPRSNYSAEPLLDYFAQWNTARRELGFAQQFKRQFMTYQSYIDKKRQDAQLRLNKFNRILSLNDDSTVVDDIDIFQRGNKGELAQLEELAEDLAGIQSRFFTQIKGVGDDVGIPLPEPDAFNLLDIESGNVGLLLKKLANEWGVIPTDTESVLWSKLNVNPNLSGGKLKIAMQPDFLVCSRNAALVLFERRHLVVQQEELIRFCYAALLLMLLLENGALDKTQQEIIDFWLTTMGLTGRQVELTTLATTVTQEQLGDIIKIIMQDKSLAISLLIDCMIFGRFNLKKVNKYIILLDIVSKFLGVDSENLNNAINLSNMISILPVRLLGQLPCNISHPVTQYSIGRMYDRGEVVMQDYEQAMAWYIKAGAQGELRAINRMAEMYCDSHGVERDYHKAMECYVKSAGLGDISALYRLKDIQAKWRIYDTESYELYFYKACRGVKEFHLKIVHQGNADTFVILGDIAWLMKDLTTAAAWYFKAANLENIKAQFNLGEIFSCDEYHKQAGAIETPQKYNERAKTWYCKAAKNGHLEAQIKLADIYYSNSGHGWFRSQNMKEYYNENARKAYFWYLVGQHNHKKSNHCDGGCSLMDCAVKVKVIKECSLSATQQREIELAAYESEYFKF